MEYAIKYGEVYESIPFFSNVIQTKGTSPITVQAKIGDEEYANYQTITKTGNVVTKLDIPIGTTLKLVSKTYFNYKIPWPDILFYRKQKIADQLYEMYYGNIDYNYAKDYFQSKSADLTVGGCSAIRNGLFFGRNFDWKYDECINFIVHTPKSFDHYATIGMSGAIQDITIHNIQENSIIVDDIEMYKLVPFYLLDGINERHLFSAYNITPLDSIEGSTTKIVAHKEERDVICAPMLVRYILDKFARVDDAVDYIKDYVTVYFPEDMLDAGYQCHWMIGDLNKTIIMEVKNGEFIINKSNYITNFNIYDVVFDSSNHIQYPPTHYGINQYGAGLERWDIIVDRYNNCGTQDGMIDTLKQLWFSHGYGEPFWYSELVKTDDDNGDPITVDADPDICTQAKTAAQTAFAQRDRENPNTWVSQHSSIYKINNNKLVVMSQESDETYVFNM